MKFGELKLLFSEEINKVRERRLEQGRYIIGAYNKVLKEINDTYTNNEKATKERIEELNITDHMKEKLVGLLHKPITKYLKEMQASNKLKEDLDKLLGIGSKKVEELIAEGLTDVKQLKSKKWLKKLNLDTQIILEHDPLRYIYIEDIHKIESKLVGFRNDIILVGSYRRNKPVVRDIDILFMHKTKNDIEEYLEYLKKTFSNKIWIYANGEMKISMIIQPNKNNASLKYKADIFITNTDNYYSMLLYSTGSKEHNIKMRSVARRNGYLLNQDGIFDLKTKIKVNKSGDNEKKLFEILGMNFVHPTQRF